MVLDDQEPCRPMQTEAVTAQKDASQLIAQYVFSNIYDSFTESRLDIFCINIHTYLMAKMCYSYIRGVVFISTPGAVHVAGVYRQS